MRGVLSMATVYDAKFGPVPDLFCNHKLPRMKSYYVHNGRYVWSGKPVWGIGSEGG